MPEFTALHLAMLASLLVVGIGLGWLLRSDRCAREKIAINAGWQEQLELRQAENDRLTEQNRSLMQQVNDQQASGSDSAARAKELGSSLRDALKERDELRRSSAGLRGSLDAALAERDGLQRDVESREGRLAAAASTLKEKDAKIFRLSRQLSGWQERVPPLVEKFRQRDREVQELQSELDRAVNRIAELEAATRPDETRIEAVDEEALGRLDACNDQYGEEGDRDDLQQIKGVGPAIERTLNELGIYRFDQISGISEYDIDRVAGRLKGFRSRIYREDWIGQARSLERAKRPDPE